jgi:CheY-like chemotaxis protein
VEKTKALIISGAATTVASIATLIQGLHGSTEAANTAVDGLESYMAFRNEIRLVLCDLTLPDFSGLELLSLIKKVEKQSQESIPFFLITAERKKETVEKASALGVAGWIPVPLKKEHVFAAYQRSKS